MTESRAGWGDRQDRPVDLPSRSNPDDQPAPSYGPAASSDDAGIDLAELLRRSGNGDEAVLAALHDATSPKVHRMTSRVSRSPEIAAGVLQEASLMAWQEVEQALDTHEVQAAMGALTPLPRHAVSLAHYERGAYQQVAQRLELPLGTAKAGIRDGPSRLRTAWGARP